MELRNCYWLLRHGRSTANESDVIVSFLASQGLFGKKLQQTRDNGVDPKWGLTAVGREQAAGAGVELRQRLVDAGVDLGSSGQLLMLASPFSRTMETAQGALGQLGAAGVAIQEAPELRERNFGGYELQSCSNYERVWADDAEDPGRQPPGGGESVQDVAQRLRGLIERLEAAHAGRHIVLVSHGDALSVLAAVLLGGDLWRHRQHGLPNCGILRVPAAAA